MRVQYPFCHGQLLASEEIEQAFDSGAVDRVVTTVQILGLGLVVGKGFEELPRSQFRSRILVRVIWRMRRRLWENTMKR